MLVNVDLIKVATVRPVHMHSSAGAGSPAMAQARETMPCQILSGKEVAAMGADAVVALVRVVYKGNIRHSVACTRDTRFL